jgi:hypothetical protein
VMDLRRLMPPPGSGRGIVATWASTPEEGYVRLGSKADICSAKRHVRFTPNSDRKSGFPQKAMSALALKADLDASE